MNKAIFWDLQGTLGGTATGNINNFELFPFTFDALKLSKNKGFLNIIITNQSKIGKGKITFSEYEESVDRIKKLLKKDNVDVEEFLCCPHNDEDNCSCKKPKTGFVNYCIVKYNLDIQQCFVVGDMGKNEIIMAKNAKCYGVLVLTGGGKESLDKYRSTWAGYDADIIAENAFEAIKIIVGLSS